MHKVATVKRYGEHLGADMPNHSTQSGRGRPPGLADPALSTWDTAYVTPRDRFSYFREGICQAFCPFSPENPQNHDVEARVESYQVARGSIGRLQMTPLRLYRDQADIAKITDECLALGLQLRGGMRGQLGGQPFSVKTGDIAFASTIDGLDCHIDEDRGFSAVSIVFPRTALDNCAEIGRDFALGQADLESLRLLFLLINERMRYAQQQEMTHLFDATVSLLMAALIRDRDFLEDRCGQESSVRKGLLQTIQAFVAQEIANPHLSTGHVASRFSVSPRYVQKLFASEGTTFKSTVTNARLDRIRSDLLDVALIHVGANEIAYRWGFRDTTTFHRTFKSRFDDTPFQMRSSAASNLQGRLRCRP